MSCGLKNSPELIPLVKNDVQFYINEECMGDETKCRPYNKDLGGDKPVFHVEYVQGNHITERDVTSRGGTLTKRPSQSSGFGGRWRALMPRAEQAEVERVVLIKGRSFCPAFPHMVSRLAVLDLTGESYGCDETEIRKVPVVRD
jgi:hypothetical protein